MALELDLTQQSISKLEQKEEIDDETLVKVANVFAHSGRSDKEFQ